ncbi:hypothetical protein RUND412_000008 [Rhizina undulata]
MAVERNLLDRHLELLSENANLQQQLNRLAKLSTALFENMDTHLQENEQLRNKLGKENSLLIPSQQGAAGEGLGANIHLDKIRLIETTPGANNMKIVNHLEKQAQSYASKIFESKVDATIPFQDNQNSNLNRAKASLQEVNVGESRGGKDGWIQKHFDAAKHSIGSEETMSSLAIPTPEDSEPDLIAIEHVEVIHPPQKEAHAEVPEMSRELVRVSQWDAQPSRRHIQPTTTDNHNRRAKPSVLKNPFKSLDKNQLALMREVRIYGIPHGFTYSELSEMIRGGKIDKMLIRDDPQIPASAMVLFVHARDAIRFYRWSQRWDLYMCDRRIYTEIGSHPPHSETWAYSIDGGASRVLIFETMPPMAWAQTKESFMNLLRRKWMDYARNMYHFDFESCERKVDNGRSKIIVIFRSLKQATLLRKQLRYQGWTVSFGVDPCEGPIEELETEAREYQPRVRSNDRYNRNASD